MPGTDDDVFDEIFNDDEAQILNDVPAAPAADAPADGNPVAAPVAPGAPAADAATPTDAPDPAAPDNERDEFLARHQAKTPAELADMLFQQQKRADRANFAARSSQKAIEDIRANAAATLQARRDKIEADKKAFAETLESDPDAAAKLLADRAFAAEEQAAQNDADQLDQDLRFDEAINFAGKYIPDFGKVAPAMQSFGTEMGFSPQEVAAIDDGRQLVTLYLASLAGNMIKAGAIDLRGNLIAAKAVADDITDPRLKQPGAPTTAGSGGGQPSVTTPLDKQAAAMLQMSEEDFAKLSDEDLAKVFGG